jgi:hypothetical protein
MAAPTKSFKRYRLMVRIVLLSRRPPGEAKGIRLA